MSGLKSMGLYLFLSCWSCLALKDAFLRVLVALLGKNPLLGAGEGYDREFLQNRTIAKWNRYQMVVQVVLERWLAKSWLRTSPGV